MEEQHQLNWQRTPIREISGSEWRWVLAWATVVLLLVNTPYIMAHFLAPAELMTVRILYYGGDFSQYLAAMREGATSASWLIHDHFTPEPHPPVLMYTLYVALGKLAALTNLSLLTVYWAVAVISLVILSLSIYALGATFLGSTSERRVSYLLTLFSSGFGWIIAVGQAIPLMAPLANRYQTGLTRAEVSTFLVLFAAPHLVLGLSMILLISSLFVRATSQPRRGLLLSIALCTLALGLINPFSLVTINAVCLAYTATKMALTRGIPQRELKGYVVILLTSAPLMVYNFYAFGLHPFWSQVYGQQNITPTPPPDAMMMGYGIVFFLALLGGIALARHPAAAHLFLLVWAVSIFVLMYAPLSFQRRFAFGLHPILCVLAAVGLSSLTGHLQARKTLLRLTRYLVLALATGTTIMVYVVLLQSSLAKGQLDLMLFERRATVEAASWLRHHTTSGDVVLAAEDDGNYLAGEIPGRVFLGHSGATLDPAGKREAVAAFFDENTTDSERQELIARHRPTLLFHGPRERALGDFDPTQSSCYRELYSNSEITIYQIAWPAN